METAREAKQFLQRLLILDDRIDERLDQAQRIRERAERITQAFGERMPGGGGVRSPIEDAAVRLADLERRMERIVTEYCDLRTATEEILARMPTERERQLLELRYVEALPWLEVMEEMHYASTRSMHIIHGNALCAFVRAYNEWERETRKQ